MTFNRAIVSRPSDPPNGKTARGDNVLIHATTAATDGAVGMWDGIVAPGTGPKWHRHARETEIFRVISGRFRFWCGDQAFDLEEGGVITLPPNVPHQFRNIGKTPGRLFAIVTPGGFERNFSDIASWSAVTGDALDRLDATLAIINGPPLTGAQPEWTPEA